MATTGSDLLLEGFPEKVHNPLMYHILHVHPVVFGLYSVFCCHCSPVNYLCVQVVLRSINSSKSAYFSVSFQNTFFDEYNVFQRNVVQAGVLMKVKGFGQSFQTQGCNPTPLLLCSTS